MANRVWFAYAAIVVAAAGGMVGAGAYWSAQRATAIDDYRRQQSFTAEIAAGKAESAFAAIYQNIRTISLLPGVGSLDRHATNLTAETKGAIQQIYNNLAANVAVSELYILPADFDPERLDPATGHHETPIIAFDELIVGGTTQGTESGKQDSVLPADRDFEGIPDDSGVPQIEIQEYRRLHDQLQWMQQHYPTRDKIDGLGLPMIGSAELITCDNSVFDKTRKDIDRLGLVQLVPFYGADGKLKGGVAAIMRSDSYRSLLPGADYSLVNTGYAYTSGAPATGQEAASLPWVQGGKADPSLIYSEVLPVRTADVSNPWQLWVGHPNAAFEASPSAAGVHAGQTATLVGIAALMLAGLGIAFVVNRSIQKGRVAERRLEGRVEERTAEVQALAAQAAAASEANAHQRREMMASLRDAFGSVVTAARSGDLGHRVNTAFEDPEIEELAGGVNALMDTVERGLAETSTVLEALANTDLTRRVAGDYAGAFNRLKTDTNAVADSITEIVTRLGETSGGVRAATAEILAGANDLAQRSTRQAAAVEETSAAMEHLASTVEENAGRTQAASASSRSISEIAGRTGDAMHEANEAMQRIAGSSEKISSIIGVIDDIAFQTNLLALNASVEAARAGDAGKGFGVVAIEVRRLAQSAAVASGDVKELIQQAAAEVARGQQLVEGVTAQLGDMVGRVRENDRLIDGIATATREQSRSIAEVTAAIRQMDEMTQHNAALVEETNAAIEQTESQATQLDDIVSVFVLKTNAHGDVSTSTLRQPASLPATKHINVVRHLQNKVRSAAGSVGN